MVFNVTYIPADIVGWYEYLLKHYNIHLVFADPSCSKTMFLSTLTDSFSVVASFKIFPLHFCWYVFVCAMKNKINNIIFYM